MVKVREGEEDSLPSSHTPSATLTPTTSPLAQPNPLPNSESIGTAPPLLPPPTSSSSSSTGVPSLSSLSISGQFSLTSTINFSAGDEGAPSAPPQVHTPPHHQDPYHHHHHHHYHHHRFHHPPHTYYNYYNYQPWGRGNGVVGNTSAGRRHSPHHHHHHYHHYQNGSSPGEGSSKEDNSHYNNIHQNGSPSGNAGERCGGVNTSSSSSQNNNSSNNQNNNNSSNNNTNNNNNTTNNNGTNSSNNHYSHNHNNSSNGGSNKNSNYQYHDDGYYNYKSNGSSYSHCYQGYHQGGYYHNSSSSYPGGKGRHNKYNRDDSWSSCVNIGGGGRGDVGCDRGGRGRGGVSSDNRGGGSRYKAISPTPSRSRGTSPRARNSTSSTGGFSTSVPSMDEPIGSITVEIGGAHGLVGPGATFAGGLEDGLNVGGPVEEGQHVVHLHINPGTTVNFTTEDGHIQKISGPASVRMVSSNPSPPIPMPVQVPPGHVVQQIVDETGTLRHVILSAQPVPVPICPFHLGTNTGQGPPQFYGPPPPQGYCPPYQPPTPYSNVMTPPLTQQPILNCSNNGTEEEEGIPTDEGIEDTRNTLLQLLSQVKQPKVVDVTPFKAVLHWSAPDLGGLREEKSISELLYEVFLNNMLHLTVATTEVTIPDLKPATEYKVHLQCLCGDIRGDSTGVTTFNTLSTVPDPPQVPRLTHKTKNMLQLRWGPVKDNGSRVTNFILEVCGGNTSEWTEVFKGRAKQYTISKLQPNTCYRVRLAAINDNGKSDYSAEITAQTSGIAPSQPQPPSLEKGSVNSLSLGWLKRPEEEMFTLQMEDSLNGYGFRPVYNGRETKYTCQGLRRNADYKFRLCSHNDEGTSQFSDITCYRTLPDRPKAPGSLSVKGRTKATRFTACWSPPSDHGGSPVTSYKVEIDRGNGFEHVYKGESLEADCTDLLPGTIYKIRISSISPGGTSDWSDLLTATTEAVLPGQVQPPRLLGKPKACTLQLQWCPPEYDGGAPITEYNIEMMSPDSDRRQVYCGRDLECTVASLLPGRPYIFLVRSSNRIGMGPWSEPLEVVSGAGPPDAPHAPNLACKSPHSVHLSWEEPINNGAGIEQYTVQVAEVSCPHAESSESSSTCGDLESELTFSTAYTGSVTTTEVRNLAPATTYAFRVSCSNSAGSGPWSSHATVTTPAAPPAAVAYISPTASATSVTLLWGEPASHGDPISHYVIEIGDKMVSTSGPEIEYTIEDLLPETLYKIRIQAVNSVGPGCFSGYQKVTTRPLPPNPPNIDLVKASYNSLKLKWGDGRNGDMLIYTLEMEFLNPHSGMREFYQVYSGTNQNFKLGRLDENTEYKLRISASNEAGVGPYSPITYLSTTKAPPPTPKAPRVTEVEGNHVVEWCSVRCPGEDSIVYRLQVAVKDQDYCMVYSGTETSYALNDLEPQTGYYVRVCGVRMCGDGETMAGAFSSPTLFNTPKPAALIAAKPLASSTQETGLQWHNLSDQQKAVVILAIFSLFCAIAAIGLHHFLTGITGRTER